MANLVRLYLVLCKMDVRVRKMVPPWFVDIICCFSLCEKIKGNTASKSVDFARKHNIKMDIKVYTNISDDEKQYVISSVRELGFENNENLQMFASKTETAKYPEFDLTLPYESITAMSEFHLEKKIFFIIGIEGFGPCNKL